MDSATRIDPQRKKILKLLKTKPFVTNLDLMKICIRYGARIHELRQLGYNVQREYWKPGVHRYWINEREEFGEIS